MILIRQISVCMLVMLTTSSISLARGWRGIVPLHSSCEDAKRLLGISKCQTGSYDFKDERAFVWFSEKPCVDGWNVPQGTVTSIEVFPKRKLQLNDLSLDEKRFQKETSKGEADRYVDKDEGLIITAYPNGEVRSIGYGPATEDEYLRYPNALTNQPTTLGGPGGDPDGIRELDSYGDLSLNKEHQRLDNLALALRNEPSTQGYIVVYAGRRTYAGEAKARAWGAKNYLIGNRGIEDRRIVTVDGGYRERLTVELFVGAKGSAPIPSPTVCPSEVHIAVPRTIGKRRPKVPPRTNYK